MDPNETLKELRQLARHVIDNTDGVDDYAGRDRLHDLTEEAENMAILFQALDEWLGQKGFLPIDWKRGCPTCEN